jgi:hypothetical protein
MHSSRFAESLLSLVTSQERSASMVGDFTESSRGVLWFWSSVLRAGVSLLWKDVASSPGRMTTLAVSGAGVYTVISFPFLVFLVAALVPAVIVFELLHIEISWLISPWFALIVLSGAVPSPFLTGRWLARRAPGRELAPCLALTLLTAVLWSAAYLIWGQEVSLMNGLSGVMPTLLCLFIANISLYAGAVWVRRHPSELRWFEAFPATLLPEPLAPAARRREQRIEAWLLFSVFLALMLLPAVGWPTGHDLHGLPDIASDLLALFSLVCFGYAATRRGSEPMRLWLLRLRFAGMGAVSAWAAWLALR